MVPIIGSTPWSPSIIAVHPSWGHGCHCDLLKYYLVPVAENEYPPVLSVNGEQIRYLFLIPTGLYFQAPMEVVSKAMADVLLGISALGRSLVHYIGCLYTCSRVCLGGSF